jgi:quinol monooxygenase YgiN
VIVIIRFEVDPERVPEFRSRAEAAVALLAEKPGHLSGELARNLDDPILWTITTRWRDVGSYRRALQGYESKTVVVPLLSLALDEPSAYEHPDLH